MSDSRKPDGRRQAVSRHKAVLVVDASDDGDPLTNPVATATQPSSQVVPMGDYPVLRLFFGGIHGTAADGKTFNYQVIAWYVMPFVTDAIPERWVGHLLVKGAVTLGASVITGISKSGFADTITETLGNTRVIINPPTADDSVASITFGTRNAMIVTVETDLGTATGAYVWAVPGEVAISSAVQEAAKISVKTAAYSVLASDYHTIFTNEGATGEVEFTLPAAAAGVGPFTLYVQDDDGIKITAGSGDTIRVGDAVTAAAGSIDATAVGAAITLVAINATEYVAVNDQGAW